VITKKLYHYPIVLLIAESSAYMIASHIVIIGYVSKNYVYDTIRYNMM